MLKVSKTKIFNIEGALRGMRNPLESWDKSDSSFLTTSIPTGDTFINRFGENDYKLAKTLTVAGPDHRKFMRQIFVSCDITAPLYWWKEMDQYKVGTVTNSTSTMHKLGSRLLNENDFSWDYMTHGRIRALTELNYLIKMWQKTKSKNTWRELIQDLPSSFNQTRTWTGNYEVLRNIYHSRKSHKLSEWNELCKWIVTLPYSELIIMEVK